MNKFTKIEIKGFRRLHDVKLDIRPVTVMIGANGAGKTSLLDVFSLLSASTVGRLGDKLSELGGLSAVLTLGKTSALDLSLDMVVPNYPPLEYSLTLETTGNTYSIASEKLTQQTRRESATPMKYIESAYQNITYYDVVARRLVHPNWNHNFHETSLSQVPKMFQQPEELRQTLSSATFYHALNVEPRAPIRLPQPMKTAALPGKDGEDIASLLYFLRETHNARFETLEDTLRAAFPDFIELNFPPVATGMLGMTWQDRNFGTLSMNQLSEGTLRFLWLTALLLSPGLSAITMIDEPEVSLHPELLRHLAELFREASKTTNVIVATHSDRLVRFLKPEELVVVDIDSGGFSELKWADTFDLEEWLKEYTLDQVWQKGRIGARA